MKNKMKKLKYKLRCPMYYETVQCDGKLIFVNHGGTQIGTFGGLDRNYHAEFFVCPRCGVRLHRTYQWKEWKENE